LKGRSGQVVNTIAIIGSKTIGVPSMS